MERRYFLSLLAASIVMAGPVLAADLRSATSRKKGAGPMTLSITSTAFKNGEPIPAQYTGDGKDVSPPLRWDAPPEMTKSIALIADDPDAPRGTWTHWVLFNLPPSVHQLDEGVPAEGTLSSGARQGTNDFRKLGYGGPAPPPGKPHRYFFKVYALDTVLELKPGATKKDVTAAMESHILAEGQLMGTYGRTQK